MGCVSSTSGEGQEKAGFGTAYKLGKKLGEGAFGQVRVAKHRKTKEDYAVKIMDVSRREPAASSSELVDKARMRATRAEIAVWQAIKESEYIVALYEVYRDVTLFYMVMEVCSHSLMDKLVKEDLSEADVIDMFRQMLLGLAHVHACGVAHRDIKPDNFLFGGEDAKVLKLSDFGLACMLTPGKTLSGVYGTAPYMSPEMLSSKGYTEVTDVWSIGACAHLVVYGDFPYTPQEATATAMKKAIVSNIPPLAFDRDTSKGLVVGQVKGAVALAEALLQRNPEKRPSATEALQLPFFQAKPVAPKPVEPVEGGEVHRKQKVKTLTTAFKRPVNPIVQRGIEDLLQRLNVKYRSDASSSHFFSEGEAEAEEDDPATPKRAEHGRIILHTRSGHRHSTTAGIISADSARSLAQSAV